MYQFTGADSTCMSHIEKLWVCDWLFFIYSINEKISVYSFNWGLFLFFITNLQLKKWIVVSFWNNIFVNKMISLFIINIAGSITTSHNFHLSLYILQPLFSSVSLLRVLGNMLELLYGIFIGDSIVSWKIVVSNH